MEIDYESIMKLAAALQPKVIDGDGENPRVVVPQGFQVASLESKLAAPSRIRQRVNLSEVAGFIAYCEEYGADTSKFFASKESLTVSCVVDYHSPDTPSWATHRATLILARTPEWLTWEGESGKPMEQVNFAHFLEKNLAEIVDPPGAQVLEIASTLEARKGVQFKSAVTLSNGQRTFAYDEQIEGKAGVGGKLAIPERFKLALRPFEGTDPFEVEAFFRYRIESGNLKLWFELIRPDKVTEHAWFEVIEKIESNGWKVFAGTLG